MKDRLLIPAHLWLLCLPFSAGLSLHFPTEALDLSRRDLLSSIHSVAIAATGLSLPASATDDAVGGGERSQSDSFDYKAVANDIASLIDRVPYRGPPMVRLAWHSSGTYDTSTSTGGSKGGTIRFDEELAHEENAGLKQSAVKILEPIKQKYGPSLSYADLYTLAGGKRLGIQMY